MPAAPARRPVLADGNARLAAARRLTRTRERRESGLFLAEGVQAVREALRRPGTVLELFATGAALEQHRELLADQPASMVSIVSERAAARLSETVSPQGLVAVCRQRHSSAREAFAAVPAPVPALVAALVDAGDPGNAGTILRSADAAGAEVVAFCGGADPYGGKCVRASVGSLFHVDLVIEPDPAVLLAAARAAGLNVLAAAGDGEHALDELDALSRPTLWLFGNEAHGLAPEVLAAADLRVRVPIYGRAESLNVASAAALCLYASARAQRATPGRQR